MPLQPTALPQQRENNTMNKILEHEAKVTKAACAMGREEGKGVMVLGLKFRSVQSSSLKIDPFSGIVFIEEIAEHSGCIVLCAYF